NSFAHQVRLRRQLLRPCQLLILHNQMNNYRQRQNNLQRHDIGRNYGNLEVQPPQQPDGYQHTDTAAQNRQNYPVPATKQKPEHGNYYRGNQASEQYQVTFNDFDQLVSEQIIAAQKKFTGIAIGLKNGADLFNFFGSLQIERFFQRCPLF